jgi:outer membrane protein assembly factor BamB
MDGTATTGRSIFSRPFDLRIRWTRKLGPGYSGVVVADGVAITMFSDGTNDVVVGLSSDTGRERWRAMLAPTFPARDGSTGGPVSTPAIADGQVFALGPHGDLVALRTTDGRQVWKRHLVRELGATTPHWGFTTSPLVTANAVVVLTGAGEGRAVTAFDRRTGATVWQAGTDVASYQSPMLVRLGGSDQVVAAGDQWLFGLDPRDGRELWKYEHRGAGFYAKITNPVVVSTNSLLLTYRPDESVLLKFDRPDAPPVVAWTSRELKLNYGTPIVQRDTVFGYSGGFLTAIDSATGVVRWVERAHHRSAR